MNTLHYIANLRLPTEKAYGIQITKMCEAFARLGVRVELLLPTRRNPISADLFSYYQVQQNFQVHTVWTPDFYWRGKLDRIAVGIKEFISAVFLAVTAITTGADVIFSRDELPLYLLSFVKNNLVFEAHKYSAKRALFYRRFRTANVKIVTISQGIADEFVRYHFPPGSIRVAHDGVDLKQFDIPVTRVECRSRLGLPLDKNIIGYVGQLRTMGAEKGIENLIQMQRRLTAAGSGTMTVVVGGSVADIGYYRQLSLKNGLGEHEILFVGRKEHKEVPYYLKAFDVLAMPFPRTQHYSQYMSPLKLFEYMASGIPIIASDLPVIREILNSSNALLVPPDDVDALARAVTNVLRNPALGSRIGQRALLDVRAYTWDTRAADIVRYLS